MSTDRLCVATRPRDQFQLQLYIAGGIYFLDGTIWVQLAVLFVKVLTRLIEMKLQFVPISARFRLQSVNAALEVVEFQFN